MNSSSVTLVTHNGKFHADDIFACATLKLLLQKQNISFTVERTRDEQIINQADYVFDVGGIYDPEQKRFDHHQIGGAGNRENGTPYAAFGLVWKEYGAQVCGSDAIASFLDNRLVAPIDAEDNGMSICSIHGDISPYKIQDVFASFRPTWKEGYTDAEYMKQFLYAVDLAVIILEREIAWHKDAEQARDLFNADYEKRKHDQIIVLSDQYPWELFAHEHEDILFVVYPRCDVWRVGTIRKEKFSFENKKDFPETWAGLRDADLQRITGVPDAIFCHNARFLAVAKSKEGAIQLAEKALAEN